MKIQKFAMIALLSALAAATGPLLPARAADAATRACDEQRVFSVDAVNLDFGKGTITVTAEGMASTLGWKSPALKRIPGGGAPATVTYEFVGCRPAFGAEVMTPISAKVTITEKSDAVRHVVIQAQTNSQTLDVAEFQRGAVVHD